MSQLIFWVIPFFVITLVLEGFTAPQLYKKNDTIANLSLGIGMLVLSFFTKIVLIALYEHCFVFLHHPDFLSGALVSWDLGHNEYPILSFILAMLIIDFAYYWFHRFSHEIHFLWSAHVVHHQSEEYNLSVALRQSWFQHIYSSVFYLPLAIIMPTEQFMLVSLLNTVGQYWVHTQLIDKLGFLESFLNTPSHHRVHHATNVEYIDKNYAGILIIWDRLFGSFIKESSDIEIKYGVLRPLNSWNIIWANFQIPYVILEQIKYILSLNHYDKTQKLKLCLKVIWAKPSWFDEWSKENHQKEKVYV